MKKHILVPLFILSAFLLNAQPISITSTFMPSNGDTARYSNANLSNLGSYQSTGTNYVWNFGGLIPVSQGLRNFTSAIFTPYPFFGSGYGEKIADSVGFGSFKFTDIYNFYRKVGSTSFNAEGMGVTYQGFPLPAFYSNEDELYFFPLNYGDRDSSTFKFSTPSNTSIPTYIKTGHRITEVDGWGLIVTPLGGMAPCLRVVTTQYSIDSIYATFGGFPVKYGWPNYQRSYQWLVNGEKVPYYEVLGTVTNGNFTPNQARYRDKPRVIGIEEIGNTIPFSLYPNPVVNDLTLKLPKTESMKLEIYTIEGKLVLSKEIKNAEETNIHTVNVSNLSSGLYIGKLYSGRAVENFKFNKQ